MHKIKYEIILIASVFLILIILAVLVFINTDKGAKAVIYLGDEVIKEVYLDEDQEFIIQGKISEMTIVVSDGKIKVLESGCSNQICVNDGFISYDTQMITCLPNEVYIKIIGDE